MIIKTRDFGLASLLIIFCFFSQGKIQAKEAYWQCFAEDVTKKQWIGFSEFKQTAGKKALDSCKKNSIVPRSCTQVKGPCISPFATGPKLIIDGQPTGAWICTALDRNGEPWINMGAPDKITAALAARAYCRSKSSIPRTCYVNTVTCRRRGFN